MGQVYPETLESEAYQEMLPKIVAILPESSVVGMLLEHEEKCKIVRSLKNGIGQHDAMSWEVLGTQFVYAGHLAEQSILLDQTMKAWLGQLTREEREQIVETMFGMLEEAQIETVDDFYHSRWKTVQEFMKAKSKLPEETQKVFTKAMKLLWSEGRKTLLKNTPLHAVLENPTQS